MSAKCQKQTCARLFDQLVGSQHEAGGNFVANGFGGLDVDHQFKVVGRSTVISDGLAPRSTRATSRARWRKTPTKRGP